jgi:hypothetical protein
MDDNLHITIPLEVDYINDQELLKKTIANAIME